MWESPVIEFENFILFAILPFPVGEDRPWHHISIFLVVPKVVFNSNSGKGVPGQSLHLGAHFLLMLLLAPRCDWPGDLFLLTPNMVDSDEDVDPPM